jgi:4-hydroxybenzoate polyprenyltransferase
MKQIRHYFSLIKFSHTVFAMPFALIGFFLGIQSKTMISAPLTIEGFDPIVYKFMLVVCCMIFARSAAMAFNRYLDRHYDKLNPRTAVREIPAGLIQPKHAMIFTIITSLLFVCCCWLINFLCFCLSFIALFVILFYSYTKRFTALCHLVLGLGLSLAPIGAYLAITGVFALLPLIFSFVVLTWVSGFDIIYAMQDDAFDKAHGLHSIPAAIGKNNAVVFSRALHAITAILLIVAGMLGYFHLIYWIGVFIFISLLFFQHTLFTVYDLSKVNLRFMSTNGIASVIFAFFVIADLLLS